MADARGSDGRRAGGSANESFEAGQEAQDRLEQGGLVREGPPGDRDERGRFVSELYYEPARQRLARWDDAEKLQ